MEYINANEILPKELFEKIQKYAGGKLLYVPQEHKKSWGEASGYRKSLQKRNRMIFERFQFGDSIEGLSREYGLSEETIKKIVYSRKRAETLRFSPDVHSAKEYEEQGLLEEWIHTYLLFVRKNRAFSDGLYLEQRYYVGPVWMPLKLFGRCSGPEEGMKWKVDPEVFEERTRKWMDKIREEELLPPLIIGYAEERFEINCNNPLFEALERLQISDFPVIIWSTCRNDYETFRRKYGNMIQTT